VPQFFAATELPAPRDLRAATWSGTARRRFRRKVTRSATKKIETRAKDRKRLTRSLSA